MNRMVSVGVRPVVPSMTLVALSCAVCSFSRFCLSVRPGATVTDTPHQTLIRQEEVALFNTLCSRSLQRRQVFPSIGAVVST